MQWCWCQRTTNLSMSQVTEFATKEQFVQFSYHVAIYFLYNKAGAASSKCCHPTSQNGGSGSKDLGSPTEACCKALHEVLAASEENSELLTSQVGHGDTTSHFFSDSQNKHIRKMPNNVGRTFSPKTVRISGRVWRFWRDFEGVCIQIYVIESVLNRLVNRFCQRSL